MSEEILELGADGCFEIPQIKIVPAPPAIEQQQHQQQQPATITTSSAVDAVLESPITSLFKRISEGEYKIIKDNDSHVNVIVCLEESVNVTRFRLSEKLIVLEVSDGRKIQIDLPVLVKANSASSKHFGKYLVIKLELL